MPGLQNICRPLNNYISNYKINQHRPDHTCNQKTSIANKTKKQLSSSRHSAESSERHYEDLNRQPVEHSKWHYEDSNRETTAENSEWHQKNSNKQREYYSEPEPGNARKQYCNHSEWQHENLNQQQYQKGAKSEKSELEARSSSAGNEYLKIGKRSCTTEVKQSAPQKHINVKTKELKNTSEKKKSKKELSIVKLLLLFLNSIIDIYIFIDRKTFCVSYLTQ